MNISQPYKFKQPPDAAEVQRLLASHVAGELADRSLCYYIKATRAMLRDGRRWLYAERHHNSNGALDYRTALLVGLARAARSLAEYEAAIEMLLARVPSPSAGIARCPTCHRGTPIGRFGGRLVVLDHLSTSSMRCSGTGELLDEGSVRLRARRAS